MLYYLAAILYVLVCLLLLLVVLLQQGKGGDIAAAFGGSSSQTAFGARAGATVLTRATTVPTHGEPPRVGEDVFGKHTTHIAAADAEGNWVGDRRLTSRHSDCDGIAASPNQTKDYVRRFDAPGSLIIGSLLGRWLGWTG